GGLGHRLAAVRGGCLGDDAQLFADPVFDFESHFGMFFQVFANIVLALAAARATIAEPGTRLVDGAGLRTQVDDFALACDARPVHDVELGLLEWRRNLVLDNLDTGFVTDDLVALLDGANTADIEADGRIELERIAARRRFGVAEHDADFHADLVDENNHAVGALDGCGQLAQGLAHEACLQAGK